MPNALITRVVEQSDDGVAQPYGIWDRGLGATLTTDEHRALYRMSFRTALQAKDINYLIDWCKGVSEMPPKQRALVDNLDIVEEEIVRYLDQRYPRVSGRRR